ncbi:ABC transporter ATP-binding protein [Agrococcus sp. ARC_14]|uniref:ABC transporter ATP-binding protein n=1 Tax=Agrococcus sp. ARC_14 TaxID=2919927 RepID=UPI001F05FDF2|nr:ABC transporter ATP-binding protein [Agrococcus sp. ARC_14]MCH1883491.1 ABC transporter ATP-binding protein [Agrococcus sp. ARC_14]
MQITVDHYSKSFGEHSVLRDLHLDIPAGQFVALVGKSGCGKSTLLRSVAGLEEASGGQILLDGEQVTRPHEHLRIMFQDDRLLPWRSVVQNVTITATDQESAVESLAAVGLSGKLDQWPASLSGGQRQRVALARALATSPDVILFDEPLGALDALTRMEMQNLIEDLWQQRGFTSLLVTHDVGEAVSFADRVIVLADGGITLDLAIDLPRPRRRDTGFLRYENTLLNAILNEPERTHP